MTAVKLISLMVFKEYENRQHKDLSNSHFMLKIMFLCSAINGMRKEKEAFQTFHLRGISQNNV